MSWSCSTALSVGLLGPKSSTRNQTATLKPRPEVPRKKGGPAPVESASPFELWRIHARWTGLKGSVRDACAVADVNRAAPSKGEIGAPELALTELKVHVDPGTVSAYVACCPSSVAFEATKWWATAGHTRGVEKAVTA